MLSVRGEGTGGIASIYVPKEYHQLGRCGRPRYLFADVSQRRIATPIVPGTDFIEQPVLGEVLKALRHGPVQRYP